MMKLLFISLATYLFFPHMISSFSSVVKHWSSGRQPTRVRSDIFITKQLDGRKTWPPQRCCCATATKDIWETTYKNQRVVFVAQIICGIFEYLRVFKHYTRDDVATVCFWFMIWPRIRNYPICWVWLDWWSESINQSDGPTHWLTRTHLLI